MATFVRNWGKILKEIFSLKKYLENWGQHFKRIFKEIFTK